MKRLDFAAGQRGLTLLELTVVLLILMALAGLVVPYIGNTGSKAACQATDASLHTVKEAVMGGTAGSGFYADTLGALPAAGKASPAYNLHFLFTQYDVDGAAKIWPDFNAKTALGWRGPYLMSGSSLNTLMLADLDATFGGVFDAANPTNDAYVHVNLKTYDGADANTDATDTEAAKLVHALDAWQRPIVLQVPYNSTGSQLDTRYARLVSAGPNGKLDTSLNDLQSANRNAGNYSNDDRVLYLRIADPAPGGNISCDDL